MATKYESSTSVVPWSILRLEGEDTLTFVQGQISADLESLRADNLVNALVLNPDGSVIAPVRARVDGSAVELSVYREVAEVVVTRLRRFLLRTRCVIELDDEPNDVVTTIGDLWEQRTPGPSECVRELSPHAYGQRLVDTTVSFTKGCFTGQELVGRLDVRGGNTPFRVVTFHGPDIASAAVALTFASAPDVTGVTSWWESPTGVTGFGVVHRTVLASGNTGVDGVVINAL